MDGWIDGRIIMVVIAFKLNNKYKSVVEKQ